MLYLILGRYFKGKFWKGRNFESLGENPSLKKKLLAKLI